MVISLIISVIKHVASAHKTGSPRSRMLTWFILLQNILRSRRRAFVTVYAWTSFTVKVCDMIFTIYSRSKKMTFECFSKKPSHQFSLQISKFCNSVALGMLILHFCPPEACLIHPNESTKTFIKRFWWTLMDKHEKTSLRDRTRQNYHSERFLSTANTFIKDAYGHLLCTLTNWTLIILQNLCFKLRDTLV